MKSKIKKEIQEAKDIIKKFNELNNISFRYNIKINYKLDCSGLYNNWNPRQININPKICFRKISKLTDTCAHGYVNSYKMSDVILHEYGHMLDERQKNIYYKALLKLPKIWINPNCDIRSEELIELFVLYINNPYLLKLISPIHYKLQKSQFVSPTPCTKPQFIKVWNTWNSSVKKHCWKIFGIIVKNGKIFSK